MASSATTAVFLTTVVIVVIAFLRAARLARIRPTITIGILLVMVVVPGFLARTGALDRYTPLPAPALLIIAALLLLMVALALSGFGGRIAAVVPLSWLVGYQVFRVAVEWTLHRLYLEGIVPVQMTYAGRNFDILTGLSAAVLAIMLRRSSSAPRLTVLLWNLTGLALLANIVTIAALSTPVPFRRFLNDPPNLLPSTFPFVWLPTFLVPAALFGHLVVFRALKVQRSNHGARGARP
jgi:hypothetical protein